MLKRQATPWATNRWYALGVITAIHAIHNVDRNVIGVVIEPLKAEFGLSDAALGLLSGLAHSGAFAVFVLPLSWLADRVNRAKMLSVVLGLWSAITALTALTANYATLFLARVGVGAAEAGGPPAMVSILADMFPAKERPTAMGVLAMGIALGTGLIYALGGKIAEDFGWRAVFLVAGLPGILLAILTWLTIREPAREIDATAGRPSFLESSRAIFTNPTVMVIVIGCTFSAASQMAVVTWMTSFLIRFHHLPLTEAALVVSVSILVGKGLGTAASGPLTSLFSRDCARSYWRYPSTMLFLSVPLGWLLVTTPSAVLSMACILLLGFTLGSWSGQAMSIILAGAPPSMRGAGVGAYQFSANLIGVGLGPTLTGALSDAFGKDGLAPAIGCALSFNLVAAASFVLACALLPRPEAAAQPATAH